MRSRSGDLRPGRGDQGLGLVRALQRTASAQHQATAEALIENAPPSSTIRIDPLVLTQATPATATWAVSDVDGDSVTARIRWLVNGAEVAADRATPEAGSFARGDLVTAALSPTESLAPSPLATPPPTTDHYAPAARLTAVPVSSRHTPRHPAPLLSPEACDWAICVLRCTPQICC